MPIAKKPLHRYSASVWERFCMKHPEFWGLAGLSIEALRNDMMPVKVGNEATWSGRSLGNRDVVPVPRGRGLPE
jgi:hypothetical protein